jgi:hypothetical protein
MPATRDAFFDAPAISVMLSADVLVDTTASAGACRFDRGHQVELEIDLFRRGFNHKVRARKRRRQVGGATQPRKARVCLSRRRFAQLNGLPEHAFDLSPALRDGGLRHVVHARLETRGSRRMRNPMPHRPRTEHCNGPYLLHEAIPARISSIVSSARSISASVL